VDLYDDSFCVFDKNPNLFMELTEFGRKHLNLSMYRDRVRNAAANVSRQSLHPLFCRKEDVHLISSFLMLYDIAVFVYKSPWKRWVMYNATGSRGYICLHFNGSHFDVLHGIGTATVVKPPTKVVLVHQHYLRLHARNDDFVETVNKARQFESLLHSTTVKSLLVL